MECKNCGSTMYERNTKRSQQSTAVYICKKCNTILYVWSDGEQKWEPDHPAK